MSKLTKTLLDGLSKRLRNPDYHIIIKGSPTITVDDKAKTVTIECLTEGANTWHLHK